MGKRQGISQQTANAEASIQSNSFLSPKAWLGLAWMAGAMVLGILISWRIKRVRAVLSSLPVVESADLLSLLERLRRELGIRRRVDLRHGGTVLAASGPMTTGVFRPVIVLPLTMAQEWKPEELEPVLAHELAHIKRLDLLMNWVQMVVQVLYFYHPLVWFANWRIRQEREWVCDDVAVRHIGGRRQHYSRSILRVLEETRSRFSFATAGIGMTEPRNSLGRRIMRIMDDKYREYHRMGRFSMVMLVVVGALCIFLASERSIRSEDGGTAPGTTEQKAQTQESPTSATLTQPSDEPPLDPKIKAMGEEAKKRITTYSDVDTFTLSDGQSIDMRLKPNGASIAALRVTAHVVEQGSTFDLAPIDANGAPLSGEPTKTNIIHDGDQYRTNVRTPRESNLYGKVQLSPVRMPDKRVRLETKVLFTKPPTAEEMKAVMLIMGKEGRALQDMQEIGMSIMDYKRENGEYPKTLGDLQKQFSPDAYSPNKAPYHYEAQRFRYILSSCGKDGVYGNADDLISLRGTNTGMTGERHEIYPLEEDKESVPMQQEQTEYLGPSGKRPKGESSISGKVLSEKTGKPIQHANLHLFSLASHDSIFINPASDGSFVFQGIPSGDYFLSIVNTAGFQGQIYNPQNRPGQNVAFTLKDKEELRDVIFHLKPSYRISGKITDENGNPPAGARELTALAWIEDQVRWSDLETTKTQFRIEAQLNLKEDGSYVLDGLDGRPVYVTFVDFRSQKKDDSYPLCYYPGTFSREEAKRVEFGDDGKATGVDFALRKTGGLVVEGTITAAETGAPVPEALIVFHHDDMLFDRVTAYTDQQGHYRIECLGPGKFTAHVDASPDGYVFTRKPLTLKAGADPVRQDFALTKGVRISGKFVDESGQEVAAVDSHGKGFGSAQIQGSKDRMEYSGVGNRKLGDLFSGAFALGEGDYQQAAMLFPDPKSFLVPAVMSGDTRLSFSPKEKGVKVLRILYQGKDIQTLGIVTKPGDKIEGVSIVVTPPSQ